LTARVIDDDGKPVAGITLRFVAVGDVGRSTGPLSSDKNGKITVPDLSPGTYRVEPDDEELRIKHVSLEVRGPDGLVLGSFEEDVSPGSPATSFQIDQLYRANMKITVGQAEQSPPQPTLSVEAARATSATLKRLNTLLEQGDMTRLESETAAVVEKEPDLGGAWYLRAVALWRTGRVLEAIESFRKALSLVPDQPGIRGALGSVLIDLGDRLRAESKGDETRLAFTEAAALLEQQCKESPTNLTFLTNRIIVLSKLEKSEDELAALKELISIDPANTKAHLRMAELLSRADRGEEAIQALRSVSNPGRDTAIAMHNLGIDLYNKGEMAALTDLMEKALKIEPDMPQLHRLFGLGLVAKGDVKGALAQLKEFLRLAPDDPDAPAERALVDALQK